MASFPAKLRDFLFSLGNWTPCSIYGKLIYAAESICFQEVKMAIIFSKHNEESAEWDDFTDEVPK